MSYFETDRVGSGDYQNTKPGLDNRQVNQVAVQLARNLTGTVTLSQLTADADNFNLPGCSIARVSTDASVRTITGFAGGTPGRIVILRHIGSNNITLANENAGSEAENRLLSTTGSDRTLAPGGMALIAYDGNSLRWLMTILP